MFDVVVIGGGIIGAAAARHLSEAGASIAVIAPPEPAGDNALGPFGAHYDVARLTWVHHIDPDETELARRSIAAIDEIEAFSDRPIFSRSGHLLVIEAGLDPERVAAAEAAAASGAMELWSVEKAQRRFPAISIPSGANVMWEPPPSGWFDPRELVAAQLRAAIQSGAERFSSPAEAIDGRAVVLRDGRTVEGNKVLLANGAYANQPGLLPRPVALRLKTETVLLAEVGPREASRLGSLPPIIYALAADGVDDVYTAPPLEYPDGQLLLKWGANTVMDRWVESVEDIDAWYGTTFVPEAVDVMSPSLSKFYPDLAIEAFHTMHCVVAYTGHGMPYIDAIDPGRLYVAIGGNGHSAKWSSALGELAAALVLNDRWVDPLPGHRFRIQWADEIDSWAGDDLLAERRS